MQGPNVITSFMMAFQLRANVHDFIVVLVLLSAAFTRAVEDEEDVASIITAEGDDRVKYKILKESPRCKATLEPGYQGHMDFIGRYQDTKEIFLNR